MKTKVICTLLAMHCVFFAMGQISIGHMDTHGPKRECLFKENANGFAEMKEVIPFTTNKEKIQSNIVIWMHSLESDVEISNTKVTDNQVCFHGKIEINEDLALFKQMASDSSKFCKEGESKMDFDCTIDIKENKLRYCFSNIVSDRIAYKGDIDSKGPINDIIWNRINGLDLQRKKSWNKNGNIWYEHIGREWFLYKVEYQIIKDMATSIKMLINNSIEENDDW